MTYNTAVYLVAVDISCNSSYVSRRFVLKRRGVPNTGIHCLVTFTKNERVQNKLFPVPLFCSQQSGSTVAAAAGCFGTRLRPVLDFASFNVMVRRALRHAAHRGPGVSRRYNGIASPSTRRLLLRRLR